MPSLLIDGTLSFNIVEIRDTLQESAELVGLHVKRIVQAQDEIGVCLFAGTVVSNHVILLSKNDNLLGCLKEWRWVLHMSTMTERVPKNG